MARLGSALIAQLLKVTDKCEENNDSKSVISQTSFPDIQEETGEEFITSLYDLNADIKTEIRIERVESGVNAYNECSNEIETNTYDQNIITPCDPIPPPALKLKPRQKKYGICPYCGDRYAQTSLSLHIRRHTGEKPYKCDMCDKAFVELHDLKRHKRMHTGEKPHVCATCGKAFSQQNKLARHNLVHTGERPYKCEYCDKSFTQRNELNLHIRRHTGFKPYTCDKVENIDDDSILSDESYPGMIEDSGEISNSRELEDVVVAAEESKVRKRIIQGVKADKSKDKKSLKCPECGRMLYSEHNLLRHMQRHKEGLMVKKKCKLSICPYCGDCFPQTSLGIHIRRHTGEKPYKCDMCEKAFVRLQDLTIHKRSHTGEKPHVCITCGKAFSRQNKLARHIRVHTGERPYKCNQCERAFAQRNDLNLHIRRHTGEKPYQCGVCGQSFFNGTLLRNHRKSESHFEEERPERLDRFIKIRVTNPTRSHRNPVSKRLLEQSKEDLSQN
ncbi:zinc finger protein 883-like [Eupeodes corollae]|uniref:zinc finger protein 883-like n=1 Tax=Eupeodes corollae TaxID=290404 RepID=UPI00249014E2|nr:zinc finger protein 883-like [Eupeodes corollae]